MPAVEVFLVAVGITVTVVTVQPHAEEAINDVIFWMKQVNGNDRANEHARDWGYKDAHDLKDAHGVGSEYDIYRDGKTGDGELRPKKGKPGEHKKILPNK